MRIRLQPGKSDAAYTMLFKSNLTLAQRVDIGPESRLRTGKILKQIATGNKVLILHQPGLPETWLAELKSVLSEQSLEAHVLILPAGESAKSTAELTKIWSYLQQSEFSREDWILALGGGAVSDIGGFAAATYLRGIKLALCPTTLLAQVDAAIGGKTAINLEHGKNLAGSFYFPEIVIIDPEYLSTLPESERKSGMGEIVKYALIESTVEEETEYKSGHLPLLKVLENNFTTNISWNDPSLLPLIASCIQMKMAVVLKDPHESRLRRCLNLGHTLGHALEKASNFQISHGQAVASGCHFALKLAQSRNLIAQAEIERFTLLLEKLGLDKSYPEELSRQTLLNAMSSDKKRQGDAIRFVLPEERLGKVNLATQITLQELGEHI
ncbi:MAG: 3-dehydroquinate synthase [Candidatus Obscuribacterales bacterium]|nr:3-dehydroquinate synthase [Candidatus Obscuribacterales bacterium]